MPRRGGPRGGPFQVLDEENVMFTTPKKRTGFDGFVIFENFVVRNVFCFALFGRP